MKLYNFKYDVGFLLFACALPGLSFVFKNLNTMNRTLLDSNLVVLKDEPNFNHHDTLSLVRF